MHALHIISYVALGVTAILLLLVLFEPPVRYRVKAPSLPLDSEEFLRILASLSDAQPHRDSAIALLAGGRAFYPAQVEAIRGATRSVHLEAFIFHPGPIGDRFLDALDRARCGGQRRQSAVG